MCLTIAANAELLTAKVDITVYKVITNNNKSLYFYFQYSPDKLYCLRKPLKVSFTSHGCSEINEGFHSFANIGGAEREMEYQGSWSFKIVKFTIPKGAKYYKGRYDYTDCYTSTSIRSGDLNSCV